MSDKTDRVKNLCEAAIERVNATISKHENDEPADLSVSLLEKVRGELEKMLEAQSPSVYRPSFGRFILDWPDDMTSPNFRYDSSGEIVKLGRTLENLEPTATAIHEYDIGGRLMWPHGDCDLTIRARGLVTLTFEEADCISGEELAQNLDKWTNREVESM